MIWWAGLNQMLPDDYSKSYVEKEMEENYGFDMEHLASYQLVAYASWGFEKKSDLEVFWFRN